MVEIWKLKDVGNSSLSTTCYLFGDIYERKCNS